MQVLRALDAPLESNGRRLDPRPERLGALSAANPSEPLGELTARFRAQGYLWLKGFLEREAVLAYRRHALSALAGAGLLAPEPDPVAGVYSGGEDKAHARTLLLEQVRSAAFESFCLQPRLWRFFDQLFSGPSYLHKRKILRYTKPGERQATGAHYDLVYLRGGTERVCTCWIPIGDIPVEMGGLLYLEGSHAKGRALEAEFARRNASLPETERISAFNRHMGESGWLSKDLPDMAERFDARWLAADYEAGDIVIHSAYMIHAAGSNRDPGGRLRLSADIRYQPVREAIDARWNDPWSPDDML